MGRYPPGGEELGRLLGTCVSGVPLFSYGPGYVKAGFKAGGTGRGA